MRSRRSSASRCRDAPAVPDVRGRHDDEEGDKGAGVDGEPVEGQPLLAACRSPSPSLAGTTRHPVSRRCRPPGTPRPPGPGRPRSPRSGRRPPPGSCFPGAARIRRPPPYSFLRRGRPRRCRPMPRAWRDRSPARSPSRLLKHGRELAEPLAERQPLGQAPDLFAASVAQLFRNRAPLVLRLGVYLCCHRPHPPVGTRLRSAENRHFVKKKIWKWKSFPDEPPQSPSPLVRPNMAASCFFKSGRTDLRPVLPHQPDRPRQPPTWRI